MSRRLRVLIVEDSETDAKLIVRELGRGGDTLEIKRVEDAEGMRTALAEASWNLIVSDWWLPHFSGADALRLLNETGQDIPFIIVSGTIGEDTAVEAMRAGARDYVLKDRLARLGVAAQRELRERQVRESRRRAERALRASEERYRRIVETTNEGVWIVDEQSKTTFINARMAGMLGYEAGEVLGWTLYDFLDPEERERARQCLESRVTGVPGQNEVRLWRRDGTSFWALVESTRILDEQGHYQGTLGMFMDITLRKRAEEALRESEERLRHVVEAIEEVFWMTDTAKTRMLYVSPAYERIWGRSCESLYRSPREWIDAVHPEDRRRVLDAATTRQALGTYDEEYRIVRPDGDVRWIRDRASALRGAKGDVVGLVGVAEDITERHGLEEQLRQAQKMEALGSLAGGVAHDFNNLLSVILTYSHMLRTELPGREELEEITLAGERAADLTRQLLAFSRRQILQPRVIDVNQIVAGMEKMLRRLIGEDVELSVVRSGQRAPAYVDPGQVEQVIMNLAVNARDAMPEGGKLTVEVAAASVGSGDARTHPCANPGPHVMLAVTDTGIGMDAATKARIFEPFFTTKEVGKGTGLGLSTVFGIVRQSAGTISVDSEQGKGTTFRIYLPVAGEVEEQPQQRLVEPDDLRGSETILLVEDGDGVRRVARSILERNGYRVLEAQNGGEALLIAESEPKIDLLLTDVVMPRMSGPQLSSRLRSVKPGLKVLFMSGYTDNAVVLNGVLRSEMSFLQKPLTPVALLTKVREVLAAPDALATGGT